MRIKGVCFGWETTTPVVRTKVSVAGQRAGMLEPKDQEQARGVAEIADGLLVARDSSPGSQHAQRFAAG
jgi:hypothetical protein